jgi:hypothetical protein
MKSFLSLCCLVLTLYHHINAQKSFEGTYSANFNNDQVRLQLQKDNQNQYSGKMTDSQQSYTIIASQSGNALTGTATESKLGIVFNISLNWQQEKLQGILVLQEGAETDKIEIVFEKEGSGSNQKSISNSEPIKNFTLPKDASRDHTLVGLWTKSENYNSGSGENFMGASYSESMVLFANGAVGDGGTQATMSGSNYLGQSESGFKELPGVSWYNISNQLYLSVERNGKTETIHLGRYYIEYGNMLLTDSNGKKTLLNRR